MWNNVFFRDGILFTIVIITIHTFEICQSKECVKNWSRIYHIFFLSFSNVIRISGAYEKTEHYFIISSNNKIYQKRKFNFTQKAKAILEIYCTVYNRIGEILNSGS